MIGFLCVFMFLPPHHGPARRPLALTQSGSGGSGSDSGGSGKRQRFTSSPEATEGPVLPDASVFHRLNGGVATIQHPMEPLRHVMRASESPVWRLWHFWRLVATGANGVVLRAATNENTRDFVAVKLQRVRPDLHHVDTQHKNDKQALRANAYQMPALRPIPYIAEIRNWSVIQHVLYHPSLGPADRLRGQRNIPLLYDWSFMHMTLADLQLFRPSVVPVLWERFYATVHKSLFGFDASPDLPYEEMVKLQDQQAQREREGILVGVIVQEWIHAGESLRKLSHARMQEASMNPELAMPAFMRDPALFFQIWTQLCCLLLYLGHRVNYQHGDMHLDNIMVLDLEHMPQHPLRGNTLIYDVPVRDQQGRYTSWRFQVHNTRYLVKLIDQGLSKTRTCLHDDRRFTGDSTCYTVSQQGHLGQPVFFLNRGDMQTLALTMIDSWGRQWKRWDDGLVPNIVTSEERARAVQARASVWAVLLHALGRHPVAPHAPHPARLELLPFFTLAYTPQMPDPVSAGVPPNKIHEMMLGNRLNKLVMHYYTLNKNCAENVESSCLTPELPTGQLSAGPWSLDEHMVLFARELGGQMTHVTPLTWTHLTAQRSGSSTNYMLPNPTDWPEDFLGDVQLQYQQPQHSRRQPYPSFLGDEVRQFFYQQRAYVPTGYNMFWGRYRDEQRCHDHQQSQPL